ncbi:hypothetical protein ENUP19_0146G0071 [Entamoeba nuttalli]|uniref:Derlin n=2 Tax=Entamoeba nuttalli TaxID=412467 RepID=K2GAG9_ENTNP|nr:Der1 family protein, putative [Entamoeba nuttalli P19]EKE39511.1 Der1 family protein, putative [Entamoeba nuttalli P19]|eukprot:XP_008858158.1 Der1 family protein, putative [Entamoeba nuttalli P19]
MEILNVFAGYPIITRTILIMIISLFVLMKVRIIHISQLSFDVDAILSGEIWRLVTPFLVYSDRFSIWFIFELLFISQALSQIEQTYRSWLHCLWVIFIGCSGILVLSFTFHFIDYVPGQLPLLFNSFSNFIIYLWSKQNREQRVAMFFIFVIPLVYFPWISLFLHVSFISEAINDIYGIFIGHVVYWLETVFPMYYNWKPLELPKFLYDLFIHPIHLEEEQNPNIELNEENQIEGQQLNENDE